MEEKYGMDFMHSRFPRIQEAIKTNGMDGWLLYSFRHNNPIVKKVLDLPPHLVQGRRLFYFIPAEGMPQKLVHGIERGALDTVPGERTIFSSWQELEAGLKKITGGAKKIAMEYSPECQIPYISIVDAGTIELVRKATGATIVSSADLIQQFDATWDDEQLMLHLDVSKALMVIQKEAFDMIRDKLRAKAKVTEYDVQQFILKRFKDNNLVTEHLPNCSVKENSGDPHYEPLPDSSKEIVPGDLILIDLWAKKNVARGVYADYTLMGYAGDSVPEKYEKIFQVVKGARDAAVSFVKDTLRQEKPLYGWQIDDVCRNYIKERGYGEYFIHRTGHSIGEEVHGNGANLDNLETKDNRRILPRTCFSIEPGIYFVGDFGVRSEINVYITDKNDALVTGTPLQQEILAIMK